MSDGCAFLWGDTACNKGHRTRAESCSRSNLWAASLCRQLISCSGVLGSGFLRTTLSRWGAPITCAHKYLATLPRVNEHARMSS